MTVYIALTCPDCHSADIVKHGKTAQGKQRYLCRNQECSRRTFILDYTNNGYKPEVKQKISEMVINGSGIRDTARVLQISCQTVTSELKKKEALIEQVNYQWLKQREIQEITVIIKNAEIDEMKSYVAKKEHERWLWHAIDHETGTMLAYVLGSRQDRMFLKLKRMLKPFGISQFYTDNLKTYERHLSKEERTVSKYKMQKIERKHLTLRTRIKRLQRKTICFSKISPMHDLVIGLYINKYEFHREI